MTDMADADSRETANESSIEELPQGITESYGTGVHAEPGYNIGKGRRLQEKIDSYTDTSPELTGGDVDAAWEQAAMVGDEAVGGTAATPDQSVVDDLGAAVGLEMDDNAFLRTNEILSERDDRRWELEPMSSEDYQERHD